MNAHMFNVGDVVRFPQGGKIVQGRIEGFLPRGDYTVELLEAADIFPAGTILSLLAGAILNGTRR